VHLLQVEKRVSLSWRGRGCFQWSVQGLRTGVCVCVSPWNPALKTLRKVPEITRNRAEHAERQRCRAGYESKDALWALCTYRQ
jgi:hypothetical protein